LGDGLFGEDGDENILLQRREEDGTEGPLFPPIPFQLVYSSPNKTMKFLMLFTRFVSLSFFVSIGIGYNTMASDDGPDYQLKYFTNWNVLLVSFYYLLAFSASMLGCCFEKSHEETDGWSDVPRAMAMILHILYEVAGSTAFLVTTVDFSLLDPRFYLLNVACHFATTLSFLVEAMLTKMTVRWDHYPIALWWYIAYVVVIWPVVLTGKVVHWPYDFLDMSTSDSLIWYTALVAGTFIFYALWYWVNRLKHALHRNIAQSKEDRLKRINEERAVAFLNRAAPDSNWSRTELA
jgi:hypothetical protein